MTVAKSAYWVLVNPTSGKVRVHHSSCRYAEGAGTEQATKHSKWLGPYEDRQEAVAAAEGVGHVDVGECQRCMFQQPAPTVTAGGRYWLNKPNGGRRGVVHVKGCTVGGG